jgi:anti-anti-sigma factor
MNVPSFDEFAFGAWRSQELPAYPRGPVDVSALDEAQLLEATEKDRQGHGGPRRLRTAMRETGSTTDLVVRGEWDLAEQATARRFIRAALERRPEWVVLDLGQLSFIDASGIHNVIEFHTRCVEEGIHLVIMPGPPPVQRPLRSAG